MREIIFRGKTTLEGMWVYGDLNHFSDGRMCIVDSEMDWCRVDPDTVGQYTGLKDKHGSMIFEGHIIRFGPKNKELSGVVNFNMYCFCVKLNVTDAFNRNNPALDIIENEYPNEIEIIGNIYDQPTGGTGND